VSAKPTFERIHAPRPADLPCLPSHLLHPPFSLQVIEAGGPIPEEGITEAFEVLHEIHEKSVLVQREGSGRGNEQGTLVAKGKGGGRNEPPRDDGVTAATVGSRHLRYRPFTQTNARWLLSPRGTVNVPSPAESARQSGRAHASFTPTTRAACAIWLGATSTPSPTSSGQCTCFATCRRRMLST